MSLVRRVHQCRPNGTRDVNARLEYSDPWLQLCQFLIDLRNSFTAANSTKCPTKSILVYLPHLECVNMKFIQLVQMQNRNRLENKKEKTTKTQKTIGSASSFGEVGEQIQTYFWWQATCFGIVSFITRTLASRRQWGSEQRAESERADSLDFKYCSKVIREFS